MTHAEKRDSTGDFDPSELEFVTRDVTPAEASAVTAVLQGLLREKEDGRRFAPTKVQSAWQVSQRPIRSPLTPGWRSFWA